MRPLAELTYYEILDLSAGATPLEIRLAYKTALELYSEDSIVIYSLFSDEEKKEILARIEEAYAILINEKARYSYDQMLSQQRGKKEKAGCWDPATYMVPLGSKDSAHTASQWEVKRQRAVENPVIKEILSREVLTGKDLKRLRTELGVSLEEISDWTKIQPGMLRFIEEDQFNELPSRLHLKGFLKAYVQYLHLNLESVVDRYMKRIQD